MKKIFVIFAIFVLLFGNLDVYALEPIMITVSGDMDKVIFDGRWTFVREWKDSTLNTLIYDDDTIIQLRTAHQENFIYVFADAVSLTQFNKYNDMAIICFDKDNKKPLIANKGDYCFMTTLGGNNPVTLQGGSPLGLTNNFKRIPNPSNLIAIGGISDYNDRYSPSPHAGYEFRIPIDLLGRSDTYGFYLGVYDSHVKKVYTFPENLTSTDFGIPSPSKWGEIVSPDKSLPEFPLPIVTLIGAFVSVIFLTRKAYSFKNH